MKRNGDKLEELLYRHLDLSKQFPLKLSDESRERILTALALETKSAASSCDEKAPWARFPAVLRFAMIVTPAVAIMVSLPFLWSLIVPDKVYAIVESIHGSLYRVADGKTLAMTVGEKIPAGTTVRTDGATGSVLKLLDGTRIEMHAGSELSLEPANGGTRIRLRDGSVSVMPSIQPAQTLYVQNREATVPVVGTTFATAQQARPEFEIADIRITPPRPDGRTVYGMEGGGAVRGGRYEVHHATMEDLIRIAFGAEADAVIGGPSWLALDQFDVIAKPPEGRTTTASINLMLQSLLADRFKLVARKDRSPLPAWVLSKGRGEPKLKPAADASGESRCRVLTNNEGLSCRNVSLDAFVDRLREDPRTTVPFMNSTGIDGSWDFDLNYPVNGGQVLIMEGHPILEAIDKQLGLKLELRDSPQPVLVVDSVNRTPTPNVPDIEKRLPPDPDKFEVASIRPCEFINPMSTGGDIGARSAAGGQLTTGCLSLYFHIVGAWNLCPASNVGPGCRRDSLNAPGWLNSKYFNIVAKAPIPVRNLFDDVNYRAMMRNLLMDRFKMVTHYEDRLMDVNTLVAVKPKFKKADPSSRTGCKSTTAGWGTPIHFACRNVTMAHFAEEISRYGVVNPAWRPIVDGSDLRGTWDLSITFMEFGGRPRQPDANGVAATPTAGVPLRIALEQQLGLKLESGRRPMPVFVIDNIEQNPTEN